MWQLSESGRAGADARRPARAAALPGAVHAEGGVARLPRQSGRRSRDRDLSALAGKSMNDRGRYRQLTYFQLMEVTLRELLVEKGLLTERQTRIRVHDSTADMRYLVLPMRPAGTRGWSEERLAALVTRDSMIGVAVAKKPRRK